MNAPPQDTEVVVIGSGASGLAAALTAAEAGVRVIVLEKQRSLGGTSNFFEGTFAVESDMQRERYITYSRDEAFRNIMEYSHWRANPRLVRAVVNESAATISWLKGQGVEFTDATINMPNAPRTYHVVKGKGEALVKALVMRLKEKGVNVLVSAQAKRILKQEDKITGIVCELDGEEALIKAKAVIVASGGYVNNKEWIKKYSGFDLGVNIIPIGNVDKMGDGIRMAFEVGATDEGLGLLELYRVGPVGPEFAMGCQIEFAATQPDLWVTPWGERFCDESIGFYDSTVGNANARFKEGYTYSIFDDSIIERMIKNGVDKNVAIQNPPGSRPLDIEREMNAAFERGSTDVFGANSIESLAEKMGIDPLTLKATIDEYNLYCEKGHDDLFAKDPKFLWPLRVQNTML